MAADFAHWLKELDLEEYLEVFARNDVDFRSVRHLTDEDLRQLGLTLGHRRRLLAAVAAQEAGGAGPDAARLRQPAARRAAQPGPERRLLTVVMIDIVGSTPLAERLDPEELREILQRYQTAATAAVVRYGGYVAKFVGDGVTAYFGWPTAHEDEAERAVRAVRDVFAAVRAIGEAHGIALAVRAGVATGEVVVGDIVGELTTDDAAATGMTPSLAERLQRMAGPFEVLVGPTTRRMLRGTFRLQHLGAQALKGFSEPIDVWRVAEDADTETRFEAAHGEGLARFQGRATELGLLRDRWQRAKTGEGQAITLAGEPGIGKSRLVEEFRRSLATDPRFGFRYQCSPHHTNRDLHPVIEHLRRSAGLADRDPPAARLAKLATFLGTTTPDPAKAVTRLATLMRIPTDGNYATVDVPPQHLRRQIIDLLVEMILFVARAQPVMVVVEDAHWADPSMLDFLADLMPAIATARVLLVITHRPELTRPWATCSHLTSVTLSRVGRAEALAIARSVGGGSVAPDRLDEVVARAEGVPLYVEEMTRVLADPGGAGRDEFGRIPTTLYSSLIARIDALGQAREVAQTCAVLGREFKHEHLERLAGGTVQDVHGGLERLVDAGLVLRRGIPPEATYTFRHALIQDAAYATLLRRRRRTLHRRAMEILGDGPGADEAGQLDLLGHHALEAEEWEAAFGYLRRAGFEALDRFALREAGSQFLRALEAGRRLPMNAETSARIVDLHFALRNVLWALGRFAEILDHLDEAERLCRQFPDDVRMGWISVYRGASLWQVGRAEESIASSERALEIARGEGNRDLGVAANFYLGCAHVTSGELLSSESYFERVVETLPGELASEKCGLPFAPSIIAHSWLIWSYAERGDFASATRHSEVALRLAERSAQPFNRAHVLYDVGYFQIVSGDLDQARASLGVSLGLIEEWRLTYLSPFTRGFLGHACVSAGDVVRGLTLLDEASRGYERIGLGLFRSLVEIQHAHALLRAGRVAEASSVLEQALERARGRRERGHEAYGLHLLGEIALATDVPDPDSAESCFRAALQRANEQHMTPLAARCHLSLADVLEKRRPDASGEHLEHARTIIAALRQTRDASTAQIPSG